MYAETHRTTTQNKIYNISSTLEGSLMPLCNQFLFPLPRGNHYSDFYQPGLILPVLVMERFQAEGDRNNFMHWKDPLAASNTGEDSELGETESKTK